MVQYTTRIFEGKLRNMTLNGGARGGWGGGGGEGSLLFSSAVDLDEHVIATLPTLRHGGATIGGTVAHRRLNALV